jgi:hypothetical protein
MCLESHCKILMTISVLPNKAMSSIPLLLVTLFFKYVTNTTGFALDVLGLKIKFEKTGRK